MSEKSKKQNPKVEDLAQYGKTLRMPKEAVKKQNKIVMEILKEEFGTLGLIAFFFNVMKERRRIKKESPETMKKIYAHGKETITEFLMFSSMFRVLSRRMGREKAWATRPFTSSSTEECR